MRIDNTQFGSLMAWVRSVDEGFVAYLSGTEYPEIPLTQAPPGEPLAGSVEEAVEQLRRALNRSAD
ncbi:hypothetical protein SAMN05661080_03633 [Modestobacter sp. DSM 44400]|nr:hypothetical protein SAMN05661080_03633 [Modestobacter sp. DSM 44400]